MTALFWWPVGMALAAVYFVFAYRMFFRAAVIAEGSQAASTHGEAAR